MIYALDSNVIIEILNNNDTVCSHRDNALKQGGDLIIPVVTDYEIWRGFYHRPTPKKEKSYVSFCGLFPISKMNDKIWKRSARIYADLRSKGRTVDDSDIFIAAMCLENNYTLVTHNTKHFDGISDLQVADWQVS
jgi:predicted nucleic acid-binding protein